MNKVQQLPHLPESLVAALSRLLKPLARLLIGRGVTYPMLCELLKKIYVDVAENRFPLPGKQQTDSRIHILTGVHRKDVRRIRHEPKVATPKAVETSSLGALLVSRWTGSPRYLDDAGHPCPLDLGSVKGEGPSFVDLMEEVSTNVRPRAVLDEWLRLGVVRIDDHKKVHLNVDAFVPEQGFEEKCYFFGENVRAHLEACVNNLQKEGDTVPERNVFYDELTASSVAELRVMAAQEGMKALQAVNRRALELQKRDASSPEAHQQMRFGFYWHQEQGENES